MWKVQKMKKRAFILIAVLVASVVSLAGCGDITSLSEGVNTALSQSNSGEATQGRRFTIPAQYFGNQSDADAHETLVKNQATDITKNSDGSYTVTMTDDAFNAFCAMNKTQTQNALHALANNSNYPGITKVDISDDMEDVTCTTQNASVTDAETKAADYIIYLVCLYKTIAAETLVCHTSFVDPANQVVYNKNYPES